MENDIMTDNAQLAVSDKSGLASFVQTGDPVTDMINRVASDPNASIETLERMIALRDKEQAALAEREFNIAFAKAQKDMPSFPKRGKGFKSDYALWEDVNQRIIKVLSDNQMSISYTSGFTDEAVTVTATLRHSSGHSISGEFYSPIESPVNSNGKDAMNKAQQRGSAMSYGKRYATINLLSLTTYGEDDDGFAIEAADTTKATMVEIKAAKTLEELNPIKVRLMADLESDKNEVIAMKKAWAAKNEELSSKSEKAA